MSDADAVEAVKSGDKEAYRQLVNRYQKMVYGIAWSRLGDPHLSEEAAQETFVKAFKYLGALRSPDKFAGWLTRIARNVSTSILRQKRLELNQHQRWQMLQTPSEIGDSALGADIPLAETLRHTLATMPENQRECLVLFYMEGKNIREAASTLGISETAMKTRLHRARLALRDLLEESLEQSLGALKPEKDISAAVMPLLPSLPIGVAGGGSAVFGIFLKPFLGLSYLFIWLWLPFGIGVMAIGALQAENLAPGVGTSFRQKAIIRDTILVTSFAALVLLVTLLILVTHAPLIPPIAAALGLWILYQGWRLLRVNRSRFAIGQVITHLIFIAMVVAMAVFRAPVQVYFFGLLLINGIFFFTVGSQSFRRDYSLFLRCEYGLLGQADKLPERRQPTSKKELIAFVRFLGSRNLAIKYSFQKDRLIIFLPSVKSRFSMFLGFTGTLSKLYLNQDGQCSASICNRDLRDLQMLKNGRITAKNMLEVSVATVVEASLHAFLSGDTAEAERLVQAEPESAVFVNPRSNSTVFRAMSLVGIVLGCWLLLFGHLFMPHTRVVSQTQIGATQAGNISGGIHGLLVGQHAIVGLFRKDMNLPDLRTLTPDQLEKTKALAVKWVEAAYGNFSFENVEPGEYSVAFFPSNNDIEGFKHYSGNSLSLMVERGTAVKLQFRPVHHLY